MVVYKFHLLEINLISFLYFKIFLIHLTTGSRLMLTTLFICLKLFKNKKEDEIYMM